MELFEASRETAADTEDFMREQFSDMSQVASYSEVLRELGVTVEHQQDVVKHWAPTIAEAAENGALPHAKAQVSVSQLPARGSALARARCQSGFLSEGRAVQALAGIDVDSLYQHLDIDAGPPSAEEDRAGLPRKDQESGVPCRCHQSIGEHHKGIMCHWEIAGGYNQFYECYTYFKNVHSGVILELGHVDMGAHFRCFPRPGGNPGANCKLISHRCHPILAACVRELTRKQ